ncbi:MAG: 1-deoxy-D-xylulose-5-phosphate reductoisomerase [Acholeplasmatales bacterium]|nr:1-deoxy-D-xylulose-5-phosphate reductoisomerase [Acholeplasmatales bacterium]
MRYVYLLGSCGSIGTQSVDILNKHKDVFKVEAISVGHDLNKAREIINLTNPSVVCFRKKEDMESFKDSSFECVYGDEGLLYIASLHRHENELLINALVGSSGLKPTVYAIKAHKDIALANKETLVMAGDIINSLIKEYNVNLYPIDSEHSAIWQCIQGESHDEILNLIITASGGSFRDKTREELVDVTRDDALKHPNWSMGEKITIDSATMMNKGFEVMEAHHLFHIDYDHIKTIMHKESVVHSLVEFKDHMIKAELGVADMRGPISYAILYPHHEDFESETLDLAKLATMHFAELSQDRFPCLAYAYEAGKKGGLYPTVLNAANEASVRLFLARKIKFLDIERIIRMYLDKEYNDEANIDNILALDKKIQDEIYSTYGGRD